MGDTKIEWTDKTWNPIRGCSRVSEGCRNCYAERVAARFGGPLVHMDKSDMPYYGLAEMTPSGPRWTGKVEFVEEHLADPLHWRKPCRIFVNSMSDLFHEKVPDEWIDRIFAVMALAPQHTFQVLTKRPQRMLDYCKTLGRHHSVDRVSQAMKGLSEEGAFYELKAGGWCFPNIWLGVSVEDQESSDERIPLLLQTPAAVRWVSYEPALGSLRIRNWLYERPINWLVCGGESGPGARPMHPDWARAARDQCVSAGVPFFFKQWGQHIPCAPMYGNEKDEFHSLDLICIEPSGLLTPENEDGYYQYQPPVGSWLVQRVGKKRAGRLLDGREWNEFPNVIEEVRATASKAGRR